MLAFCVFGIVSKTLIHMVAASCDVRVLVHRACGGDIPCLDDRLRLIMIGMNNPRTERWNVQQRGKGRVLANSISR